ncbi:MAG: flagellar basal body rod protein FlgF [Halioglobus sp.]|nr:flagellar basal body rod protein FlgF [Halioglobus sp.]
MDDFLYVAASGARETMLAQALNSNNMAHAGTTGFRADLALARSSYLSGDGLHSRVFGGLQASAVDFTEGTINATGRDLDVAINGAGWIAVLAADGSEAYTRRGDLRVNDLGQVTNGAGQAVIGESGPIALPPYSELAVGVDGTLSIVALGDDPNSLVVADTIKLVNPDRALLHKGDDGLLRLPPGEQATPDENIRLLSGSLESSNVNTVGAMVRMIELARQFETHVKIMDTAQQLDRSSAELMRLT